MKKAYTSWLGHKYRLFLYTVYYKFASTFVNFTLRAISN